MTLIIIMIVFWLACAFLAMGWTFAYLQREYPWLAERHFKKDREMALTSFLLGPIGLTTTLFVFKTIKHGWALPIKRNIPREEDTTNSN